ncbi:MAG: NAD(P)H-dependent oxidoreductase [Halanaerobiales bacterium]
MKNKQVVALTGSTRGKKTASESIVNYLQDVLADEKVEICKYRVYQIYKSENMVEELMTVLGEVDLLLISSPVYVHSLPYPLTFLMEQLADKTEQEFWTGKQMLAVIHNGYPEDIQRKASFQICENFAREMGMEWLGAIGFGGSPLIEGRPLEETGGFFKWMRRALDEVGDSIVSGERISAQAREYEEKHFPSLPRWILKILFNLRVKFMARRKGVDLTARPYEEID